jgi:hypothetical protein
MKLISRDTGLMQNGVCDIKIQNSRERQIKMPANFELRHEPLQL